MGALWRAYENEEDDVSSEVVENNRYSAQTAHDSALRHVNKA